MSECWGCGWNEMLGRGRKECAVQMLPVSVDPLSSMSWGHACRVPLVWLGLSALPASAAQGNTAAARLE